MPDPDLGHREQLRKGEHYKRNEYIRTILNIKSPRSCKSFLQRRIVLSWYSFICIASLGIANVNGSLLKTILSISRVVAAKAYRTILCRNNLQIHHITLFVSSPVTVRQDTERPFIALTHSVIMRAVDI
jgi:hypothetical protein